MRALLLLLLLPLASARPVKLAWNPNPESENVTAYRLYRGIDLVATATGTTVTADLNSGDVVHVRAVNSVGESGPSNTVTIPAGTKLTIQSSTNLSDWTDIHTMEVSKKDKEFFRIKIETP